MRWKEAILLLVLYWTKCKESSVLGHHEDTRSCFGWSEAWLLDRMKSVGNRWERDDSSDELQGNRLAILRGFYARILSRLRSMIRPKLSVQAHDDVIQKIIDRFSTAPVSTLSDIKFHFLERQVGIDLGWETGPDKGAANTRSKMHSEALFDKTSTRWTAVQHNEADLSADAPFSSGTNLQRRVVVFGCIVFVPSCEDETGHLECTISLIQKHCRKE